MSTIRWLGGFSVQNRVQAPPGMQGFRRGYGLLPPGNELVMLNVRDWQFLVTDEIVNDASAWDVIAQRLAVRISAKGCDRSAALDPRQIAESVIKLGVVQLGLLISRQPFLRGVFRFD